MDVYWLRLLLDKHEYSNPDQALKLIENINNQRKQINIVYKRKAGGYGLIIPKGNYEAERLEPLVVEPAREPSLAE